MASRRLKSKLAKDDSKLHIDLLNFINYLMVLPEELAIEYDDFSTKTTKKATDMLKMKPAPSTVRLTDALSLDMYGMDMPTAKRKIQVANRKTKLAEAKAKETEAKAKETEAKAKELSTSLVLNLRLNRTVEQLSEIAKISEAEVYEILRMYPDDNH